jgi:hypothetical protein
MYLHRPPAWQPIFIMFSVLLFTCPSKSAAGNLNMNPLIRRPLATRHHFWLIHHVATTQDMPPGRVVHAPHQPTSRFGESHIQLFFISFFSISMIYRLPFFPQGNGQSSGRKYCLDVTHRQVNRRYVDTKANVKRT